MAYYNFRDFSQVYSFTRQIKETSAFPPYLTFELTSYCNLKCVMCTHTYMRRRQTHLDFNIFKKAVDEIAEYGSAVRFIGLSEPFLYPQIIEACEYVKAKGLLLHITNNGTVIQTKHMQRLLDIGLDSIIFSMQGLTKEEYSLMRNTDKYNTFISKIKEMYRLRGNSGKPNIKITTTITSRDKLYSLEDFRKKHSGYSDEVQVTGLTCFTRIENDYGRKDIYSGFNLERPERIDGIRCMAPYYEMLINSNGKVSCCCDDGDERMVIGDASTLSLKAIWDGPKAKSIRNTLEKGEIDLLANCKNCVFHYGLGHDEIMQRILKI